VRTNESVVCFATSCLVLDGCGCSHHAFWWSALVIWPRVSFLTAALMDVTGTLLPVVSLTSWRRILPGGLWKGKKNLTPVVESFPTYANATDMPSRSTCQLLFLFLFRFLCSKKVKKKLSFVDALNLTQRSGQRVFVAGENFWKSLSSRISVLTRVECC